MFGECHVTRAEVFLAVIIVLWKGDTGCSVSSFNILNFKLLFLPLVAEIIKCVSNVWRVITWHKKSSNAVQDIFEKL